MKEEVSLEDALIMAAEVELDLRNGTRDGRMERTIQRLTGTIIDVLDEAVDIASEQAEWEFNNNPDSREAGQTCEKVERGLVIIRDKYSQMIQKALGHTYARKP